MYKSNDRLLSLVRDLLSISLIDQGKVRDLPQSTNITNLIKEVVTNMHMLAANSNISLQLDLKKNNIPIIFIDPLRVQEVIENLIANAITYSESAGKVEILLILEVTILLLG